MKKTLSFILIILILSTSIGYSDDSSYLQEGLRSVLIGDFESGEILYSHNIDQAVEMASITKVMTYLVTMDEVSKGRITLEDIVTVGRNPTRVGGSSLWLRRGEKLKLRTLLEATLIASGNDGCVAIAEHVFETEEEFVNVMNNTAKELGLNSAKFINTSGMPVGNNQNKMSVKDIFKLAKHVINKYPQILEITNKLTVDIPERNFHKKNTNPLLPEMEEVDGLKTGYTNAAGYCLVSTMIIPKSDANYEDYRVIAIVMGGKSGNDRKVRSMNLLNYARDNYSKKLVIDKKKKADTISIPNAVGINVNVYPKEDLVTILKKDDKVSTNITIDKGLKAPIAKGDVVGKITLVNNGENIGEVDLISDRDVNPASFFIRFFRYLENLILRIW